jgi:hypothetical protein
MEINHDTIHNKYGPVIRTLEVEQRDGVMLKLVSSS